MQVLTTTKRLDARLSKMFSSWGWDTGINLSKLIDAVLWNFNTEADVEKHIVLLQWRLRFPAERIRIDERGLAIKLDDGQWLEITKTDDFGIAMLRANVLNVRYWL